MDMPEPKVGYPALKISLDIVINHEKKLGVNWLSGIHFLLVVDGFEGVWDRASRDDLRYT